VLARFTGRDHHQGYPNRMHGGVIAAILDETIGRAIMARGTLRIWGVTKEIRVRYRQPVPLGIELTAVGRITAEDERIFEGTGELRLATARSQPRRTRSIASWTWIRSATSIHSAKNGGEDRLRKQPNSRMCFVCGASNSVGLNVRFYECDDNSILAYFTSCEHHTDDDGT